MTVDEFRAEMLRRGWSEEDVEGLITDYHELLENNPRIKEKNIPIDFLLCDPVYDED